MRTLRKSYEVEFKALPGADGADTGRFEALVSVFGNVDLQGDRVLPGAFDASIDTWRKSGDSIPLIWSHDWANPFAHIGSIDPQDAIETEKGLRVIGEVDLRNAFAAQVYNLMKRRLVKEFSYGYEIVESHPAKDGATNLEVLNIVEIGPTLKGANQDTELLGVKAELEAAASPDPSLTELRTAIVALKAEVAELKTRADKAEGKAATGPETGTEADDPDADLKSELARLAAQAAIQA